VAYTTQVAVAKSVCAGCPVRRECLSEALARIPYGIAGGLTEHERRALRSGAGAADQAATVRVETVLRDGPREELRPGLTARATARERSRVGQALLAAGRSCGQVAQDCGVTARTAQRWATSTTSTSTSDAGEGSRGGNRAPLRTSHPHNPLAGTRAAEGARA
jgi:hypothetical protein